MRLARSPLQHLFSTSCLRKRANPEPLPQVAARVSSRSSHLAVPWHSLDFITGYLYPRAETGPLQKAVDCKEFMNQDSIQKAHRIGFRRHQNRTHGTCSSSCSLVRAFVHWCTSAFTAGSQPCLSHRGSLWHEFDAVEAEHPVVHHGNRVADLPNAALVHVPPASRFPTKTLPQ